MSSGNHSDVFKESFVKNIYSKVRVYIGDLCLKIRVKLIASCTHKCSKTQKIHYLVKLSKSCFKYIYPHKC